MAAETDTRPSFFNQSWYSQDLPSDNQTQQDGSAVLDHGSVTFGRYASELAWEKRSVFTHNRCQEELEKFKAPGLVAQKKAYFEEYYKKIRAMKELQAQQQEMSEVVPSQDIQSSTRTTDNATDVAVTIERDELKNLSDTQFSGYDKTDGMNSFEVVISNSSELPLKEAPSDCSESKDANLTDGACVSLTVNGLQNPPERTLHPFIQSVSKSPEPRPQNGLASSKVGGNVKKIRKPEPFIKEKGAVTSARNKTEYRNRTTEVVRMFGKPKPSPQIVKSSKVEKSFPSRKGSTQIGASNINKKTSETRSSLATLRASSVNSKTGSSASNVRDNKGKTSSDSHCSGNNLKTKLPVPSRYLKATPKEVNVTRSLKSMTLNASLTATRPKDLPARGISKHNSIGIGGNNSYKKEGKVDQGKENVGARIKRGPAIVTRSLTCSIPKLDEKDKILARQSADLTHAKRLQRERKPIWR